MKKRRSQSTWPYGLKYHWSICCEPHKFFQFFSLPTFLFSFLPFSYFFSFLCLASWKTVIALPFFWPSPTTYSLHDEFLLFDKTSFLGQHYFFFSSNKAFIHAKRWTRACYSAFFLGVAVTKSSPLGWLFPSLVDCLVTS